MNWYGKAFYFVELPRRFIVTIWGTIAAWITFPESWMMLLVVLACLAFDLFIISRAPDIRLSKEDIQAKLATGEELVYLTWREVIIRLLWVAVGYGIIAVIAYYWFTNGQQPVFYSRVSIASVILMAVAYVSVTGVPLRTVKDLPAACGPAFLPLTNTEGRDYVIGALGYPIFQWPVLTVLWFTLVSMGPYNGGLGYTGELEELLCMVAGMYFILLLCLTMMQLLIVKRKVYAAQASMDFPSTI